MSFQQQADKFRERYQAIRSEIGKVIVGHDEIVHGVLTCLMIGGHCLLEGAPGLGKTLLVQTLSKTLSLDSNRIQFTPDLMPADILGTNMVVEDQNGNRSFEFQKGPIFTQICLADEINRATPKTQSAMLETMQEGTVTVGGNRYELQKPFFVLATQNPNRTRRHLSAARGSVGSIFVQVGCGVLESRRAFRDSGPNDSRSENRAAADNGWS